ncbi:DUF935 family protein [bacterium]|nr:DUF935 family protein [bacterium]
MSQISETPAYGRQYLMVSWVYSGGYWIPQYVEAYPLELFDYNEQGYLVYKPSYSVMDAQNAPPYRVLNPRHHPRMRSPMGESILSKCYWNVFFKKNAKTFWNIAAEKYGMPWVIGKYDAAVLGKLFPNMSAQDAATQLISYFRAMVRDAVMVMPDGITTELTNTSTQSASPYELIIKECNEGISRVILGHTGGAISTPGKLGGEKGAMEVRNDKIEMRKRLVVQTLNELIQWIAEINTNETALPVFRYKVTEAVRKDIAEVDQILSAAFGLKVSEEYLVKNYHYAEGDIVALKTDNEPVPGALNATMNKRLSPIVNRVISGQISDYDALEDEIKSVFPGRSPEFTETCMAEIMNMSGVNYGA